MGDNCLRIGLRMMNRVIRSYARSSAAGTSSNPAPPSFSDSPMSSVDASNCWRASVFEEPVAISSPAAPATCGQDIDVPDSDRYVPPPKNERYVDRISLPGATRSIAGPVEENDASSSLRVVAPTATVVGYAAG